MEATFTAPPSAESIGHNPEAKNPLYDSANVSDYKHLGIALDAAVPYLLNPDTLLLILRNGELIVVHMEGGEDVGRGWKRRKGGVKKFLLKRVGLRTIMPSCGTRLGAFDRKMGVFATRRGVDGVGGVFQSDNGDSSFGYLFAGSRVADAMLIQFSESEADAMNYQLHTHLTTSPKPTNNAVMTDAVDDISDDEDDIYGITTTSNSSLSKSNVPTKHHPKFSFRIVDSLICTGPIKDVVLGEPASYSTHPFSDQDKRVDLEVVTTTGEGFSGALGILQRSIRPQIISSFDMQGVVDIWTIRCSSINEKRRQSVVEPSSPKSNRSGSFSEPLDGDTSGYDRYLFISKESPPGTMVLETGEEFTEVVDKQFYVDGVTVGVGTVLDETAIIQVHTNGIVLLEAGNFELYRLLLIVK